jgi:hypothetical protein
LPLYLSKRAFATAFGAWAATSALTFLPNAQGAEPAAPEFQSPSAMASTPATRRFDFGNEEKAEPQYAEVGPQLQFEVARGYGWLETAGLQARDRSQPDLLRRDLAFSGSPHTFRVAGLASGLYRLTIICGDTEYGNHGTRVHVAGDSSVWPTLDPAVGEFLTLTGTVTVGGSALDITFDTPSPPQDWVVNALTLEKTTTAAAPVIMGRASTTPQAGQVQNAWPPVLTWDDPTKTLLDNFRQTSAKQPAGNFQPTKLNRRDYLKLIMGEVDFWKNHQNAEGAIIDPYRKEEYQYSTPAYALAAAAATVWADRKDLLESAAKAMDWSVSTLSQRRAATQHEDFYPPLIAHALPLLKPLVAPERAARWEAEIRGIDPFKIYRQAIGGNNWNLVAASGEALFQQMGLRDVKNSFVNQSITAQGGKFTSPYGLYLEGPLAYDAFPRLWLSDIVAQGYDGANAAELGEMMRRGALTSLFIQSPFGELPAGHRSAHHQWNEAEQCVIYEIYAARALKEGDANLVGMYKRAAHLALASMFRWVRPSGEMQIVKNWIHPAQSHAYEVYSGHSNYNLLPMGMLALAYQHAATTEAVSEVPAPADSGGFVIELKELHKIIANAGGTYVEIDPTSSPEYDATGLIRVHIPGVSPQLGPSDSLVKKPKYHVADGVSPSANTGIGVAWKDAGGVWRRVGELHASNIQKWILSNVSQPPQRVVFDVTYEGNLLGVSRIVERYSITPGRVQLTTKLEGYNGPLRYMWPVLADDGRTQSTIAVVDGVVSVSQDGGKTAQTFTPIGAGGVKVEAERYGNHNGWARLGVAEYPQGGEITLVIAPKTTPSTPQ